MRSKPRKRTAVPAIYKRNWKFCSIARTKAQARLPPPLLRPSCVSRLRLVSDHVSTNSHLQEMLPIDDGEKAHGFLQGGRRLLPLIGHQRSNCRCRPIGVKRPSPFAEPRSGNDPKAEIRNLLLVEITERSSTRAVPSGGVLPPLAAIGIVTQRRRDGAFATRLRRRMPNKLLAGGAVAFRQHFLEKLMVCSFHHCAFVS